MVSAVQCEKLLMYSLYETLPPQPLYWVLIAQLLSTIRCYSIQSASLWVSRSSYFTRWVYLYSASYRNEQHLILHAWDIVSHQIIIQVFHPNIRSSNVAHTLKTYLNPSSVVEPELLLLLRFSWDIALDEWTRSPHSTLNLLPWMKTDICSCWSVLIGQYFIFIHSDIALDRNRELLFFKIIFNN